MNLRHSIIPLLLLAGCQELPDGPAIYRAGTIRGITVVDWSRDGYDHVDENMIAEIRSTGATHVAILTTAYQSTPQSSEIYTDPQRTPSIDAVARLLGEARSHGLSTTLKPHIDPEDGSWRASIDPADPQKWFASYRAWLLPLASLADSLGCSQLMIGSELAGTIRHEKEWRGLIADVRALFRGEILYAASWDEASNVGFWDALDAVGVDFYFPVTNRRDPGRLEILAGWQPSLQRLQRLQRQTGKPVILTEVGYRSVDGAGRAPWEYRSAGEIDLQEQADLYWAMLEAIAGAEWITGLYLWNWQAVGSGGALDKDFTPRGKPALQELRAAWRGIE